MSQKAGNFEEIAQPQVFGRLFGLDEEACQDIPGPISLPFRFADLPLAALFKTRALNEGGLAGDFVARNWGHWGILRALERAAVWLWKINNCGIKSQPSWIHRHIPTSLSRASSEIWLTALPTFSDLPVEFKVNKMRLTAWRSVTRPEAGIVCSGSLTLPRQQRKRSTCCNV